MSETTDLLEEAKRHIATTHICCPKKVRECLDQALELLKQQPPAGDFTKECQQWLNGLSETTESGYVLFETGKLLRRACARLDTSEASKADLLEACENSPAADMFVSFANFAEQCTEKPSMAIYKGRFLGLATFLRSCVDRAEKMEAAIAKAKKEGE